VSLTIKDLLFVRSIVPLVVESPLMSSPRSRFMCLGVRDVLEIPH